MKNFYLVMAIFCFQSLCFSDFKKIEYPSVVLWGITSEIGIRVGEIPVDATLTIEEISELNDVPDSLLYINLVGNPNLSFSVIANPRERKSSYDPNISEQIAQIRRTFDSNTAEKFISDLLGTTDPNTIIPPYVDPNILSDPNYFEPINTRSFRKSSSPEKCGTVLCRFKDIKKGGQNLVLRFNLIDDPNSHFYASNGGVFEKPFKISFSDGNTLLSSSMLSLIDYMGSRNSWGFLFVPQENYRFIAKKMTMEITLRSLPGFTYPTRVLKWSTNTSPLFLN